MAKKVKTTKPTAETPAKPKIGGKGKLRPEHNPKPFTSENQPANRGRKPGSRPWRMVCEELLDADGHLFFENVEVMEMNDLTGRWILTGKKVARVRVQIPTQQMLILAAFNQAVKGNMNALKLIMERMEGAVPRSLILQGGEKGTEPVKITLGGVELEL